MSTYQEAAEVAVAYAFRYLEKQGEWPQEVLEELEARLLKGFKESCSEAEFFKREFGDLFSEMDEIVWSLKGIDMDPCDASNWGINLALLAHYLVLAQFLSETVENESFQTRLEPFAERIQLVRVLACESL